MHIDFDERSYRMDASKIPCDNTMKMRTAQQAIQVLVNARYSQAAIANEVDVGQPTISRLFTGNQRDVRGAVLVKLNELADKVAPLTPQA